MNKILKGISWDHPCGYRPLRAASTRWMEKNPGIKLKWDVRTLKEFGDYPVEKLVDRYDMILVDHPFMGEADDKGLLLSLDQYFPADFLNIQKKESVVPGYETYNYAGHQYALPVDAAAQVAAYRKDIMQASGFDLPDTLDQVEELGRDLPDETYIALPLCPTDMWCVYLSLSAQFAGNNVFSERGIKPEAGEFAIDRIKSWLSSFHPRSLEMNPIALLNLMSTGNGIAYSPFVFGYSNYARKDCNNHAVHFGNVPRYEGSSVSSLLGGVGIAISPGVNMLTRR